MFIKYDVDNSGSIDFRELVGMLAAREAKRVEEEEIVEAFDALVRLEGHAGRDIDTLSGVKIGRAGVTEALDALSLQELIHRPTLGGGNFKRVKH